LSEFGTCYCSQEELSKIDNICCDYLKMLSIWKRRGSRFTSST